MTSKEFISERMKGFLAKFRNTRIRYQFDELDGTHFLEVEPAGIQDRHDFLDWECGMTMEFIENFPAEGICFLTETSAVKIEKAEWTLYGDEYAITSQIPSNTKIELKDIRQMPERFVVFSTVASPVMNNGQKFNMTGGLTTRPEGNDYLLAA